VSPFPLALAGAGATAQIADAAGAREMAGDPAMPYDDAVRKALSERRQATRGGR
jgi:hypothetical protein